GPGSVVPVVARRGPEQVAAWLGVLRAGAAFALTPADGQAPVLTGPPLEPVPVEPGDPAVMLGGTVVATQESLLQAALTVAWLHDLDQDSRVFVTTANPVAEVFGCLCAGARLMLAGGETGITDVILPPDLAGADDITAGAVRAVSVVWQDVRP